MKTIGHLTIESNGAAADSLGFVRGKGGDRGMKDCGFRVRVWGLRDFGVLGLGSQGF